MDSNGRPLVVGKGYIIDDEQCILQSITNGGGVKRFIFKWFDRGTLRTKTRPSEWIANNPPELGVSQHGGLRKITKKRKTRKHKKRGNTKKRKSSIRRR